VGGGGPGQRRHDLLAAGNQVLQLLADRLRVAQIMVLLDQAVEQRFPGRAPHLFKTQGRQRRQGDSAFRFRIAPATLAFHDVFGLRVELDYASPTACMAPFSIDGINRKPLSYSTGYTSFRWRLPVNWPAGEITFDSPGFTQILRQEPIVHESQCLTASQRSG
jgi:hypothetical protein